MQNQHAQGIRALRSPHITFKQNGNDTEKIMLTFSPFYNFFSTKNNMVTIQKK